jgi:hypothetical protein
MADTQESLGAIETTLSSIADRQQQHEEWSEKWVHDHDQEVNEQHTKIWEAIWSLSEKPSA